MALDPNEIVSVVKKTIELTSIGIVTDMTNRLFEYPISAPEITVQFLTRYTGEMTKQALLQLRTYMTSNRVVKDKRWVTAYASIEVPTTWWQHFKQECFPAWAVRVFPVKMRLVTNTKREEIETIVVQLTCPHIPVSKEDMDRKCVRWVTAKMGDRYPWMDPADLRRDG